MTLSKAYVAFAALLLVGCAALGIAPADTFNKKLVVAYTALESAYDLAADLNRAGKMTAEEKANVLGWLDEIKATIDTADTLSDTDVTAAENRLTVALTALNALDRYLRSKA